MDNSRGLTPSTVLGETHPWNPNPRSVITPTNSSGLIESASSVESDRKSTPVSNLTLSDQIAKSYPDPEKFRRYLFGAMTAMLTRGQMQDCLDSARSCYQDYDSPDCPELVCTNCGKTEQDHAAYGDWCPAENEDELWSSTKKFHPWSAK